MKKNSTMPFLCSSTMFKGKRDQVTIRSAGVYIAEILRSLSFGSNCLQSENVKRHESEEVEYYLA